MKILCGLCLIMLHGILLTDSKDKIYEHFNADCKHLGQFLPDKNDNCHYLVCTNRRDEYGNTRLFAVRRECPYGTAVPYYYDSGYHNPCTSLNGKCQTRFGNHYGSSGQDDGSQKFNYGPTSGEYRAHGSFMGGHGSSGDVYDSSGGSSSGYGLGTKRIGPSTQGYGTKYKKRGYLSDKSNDYSGSTNDPSRYSEVTKYPRNNRYGRKASGYGGSESFTKKPKRIANSRYSGYSGYSGYSSAMGDDSDLRGGYDDDGLSMEYGYNSGNSGYSGSWAGYPAQPFTTYMSKKQRPTVFVKIEGPSKTSGHRSSSGYIDI